MVEAAKLHVRLSDGALRLEPLGETHREMLRAACADDEDFWPLYPESFGDGRFDASFDRRIANPAYLSVALYDGDACVGMSGYLVTDAASGVVQIGGTYLTQAARGTGLNRRFKQMLIDHAFACGVHRIEFRIDARNTRSQRAVEKLGAVHEGTLRRDRRIWTGHVRDTTIWSILADEWRR